MKGFLNTINSSNSTNSMSSSNPMNPMNSSNPSNSTNSSNLSREMGVAPWNGNTVPLGPTPCGVGATTSRDLFHRDPINSNNGSTA